MGTEGGSTAKEELEATLGLGLSHPHIVRTYDYATRCNAPPVSFPCTQML